jgi:protein-S-isoprenylcysteine O-methyltransferase Ste14
MATTQPAVYTDSKVKRQSVMQWLTRPWVDKSLALVAIMPFLWDIFAHHKSFHLEIPSLSYLADVSIIAGTMVFRRAPSRVTPNPWYWLLAFVATYWGFLAYSFGNQGRSVAPHLLINVLALLSIVVELWGRFSLGRNIGFVPAQREIVIHGAYRYMRHPIYTGLFIGAFADSLAYFSARNLLLTSLGVFWFVIKSFVEESFLSRDAAYASYMDRVRWRWLPGLI